MPSGTAAACTTLVCSAAWPLALVRQLLRRGNTVIVTGRDQDKLAATMRSVPELHGAVLSRFPALDTPVNKAGIMRNLKLADERDLEDVWDCPALVDG